MKEEQLKSHILQLYSIMLADDVIDQRELNTLFEIGKRKGLSENEIRDIILSPASRNAFPKTIEGKISLLYDMIEIAWADGIIQNSEREALERLSTKLGFYEENIPDMLNYLIEENKKGTLLDTILQNINN